MGPSREKVRAGKVTGVSGAHWLAVDDSMRRWRELHETYTVCTVVAPKAGGPSRGRIRYRGREWSAEPGKVLLMEPGETHATHAVEGSASFRLLRIEPPLMNRLLAGREYAKQAHWTPLVDLHPALHRRLCLLHATLEDGAPAAPAESFHEVFDALITTALEQPAAARHAPVRRRELRRALEYIHAHYASPLSLSALAEACGLGRFRVDQVFAATLGMSPSQYQQALRIRVAQERLRAHAQIGSVAQAVGFYDHAQFCRVFKATTGLTPSAFVAVTCRARTSPAP